MTPTYGDFRSIFPDAEEAAKAGYEMSRQLAITLGFMQAMFLRYGAHTAECSGSGCDCGFEQIDTELRTDPDLIMERAVACVEAHKAREAERN